MILISNLVLNISDNVSAVPSTEIYGADKKTYINTGSGIVFKLTWETPTLTNDTVDHYVLVIKRYDPTLSVYSDIFNKNIGLVNDFCVDSPILPVAPAQYLTSVYLAAYGKQGSVITSNILNPYISAGGGTYVKVEGDELATYAQPIMKRALGFVNITSSMSAATAALQTILTDSDGKVLLDSLDRKLAPKAAAKILNRYGVQIQDAEGKALFAPATRLLENTNGWAVVQQGYTKAADGTWHTNNLEYEVLQVLNKNGEYEVLIADKDDNKPVYIY